MAGSFIVFFWLRHLELKNESDDSDPDLDVVRQIALHENQTPQQNHMISITRVQKSLLRKFVTLPIGLALVKKFAGHETERPGFLANIGTIHSARFVRLPGTRKLVFLSNYNGSWESYLEDFVEKGSDGMTSIWSNCEGFPETELLFTKGAKDGDRFKRFARRSMQPTLMWYSAYDDLTAAQIRRNALVTRGLTVADTGTNAEAWLDLFGSLQRPDAYIEKEDVQSIIFTGNRRLVQGVCHAVAFPESSKLDQRQHWVSEITEHIDLGKSSKKDGVAYLAFSSRGLACLDMPEAVGRQNDDDRTNVPGFPTAFSFGMDHPTRRNVLGDVGDNNPENWSWGQNSTDREYVKPVATDAVIILYAFDEN